MALVELPRGYRCAGRCGVDEFCSDVMFRNGYCHKPIDRIAGLVLEFGEDDVKVKAMRAGMRMDRERRELDKPDYSG